MNNLIITPAMRVTPAEGSRFTPSVPKGGNTDFGAALRSAVNSAVDIGHQAEVIATKAITEGGNVTEVVTALTRAELTLQSATAVRDRLLQAYQDIMHIQI